jgi:hypothetical protein
MSQRILVVGTSESGKTSLVNKLITDIDVPVFIHDPIGSEWTRVNARFESSEELRVLIAGQKGAPCVAVIDEAAEFFRVGQHMNHWIFSRGRHHAMLPIAIAQRLKMMAPNVREQATDLYVFESGKEASGILATEYNCDDLLCAPELSQGEYFHVRRVDGERICTAHALW